ncbi:hypothetical protein KW507_15705 [Vibrio fluvialis]|nr:hypothetical protein [Vibrio fluvialis]
MTMIVANLSALKNTVYSMKNSLEFMNVDIQKLNCLIDAREYLEDAKGELKLYGTEKGMPTAIPYMERAWKRLDLMKEYAEKDMQHDSDAVNLLIVAQCNVVMPMLDQVINKSLER